MPRPSDRAAARPRGRAAVALAALAALSACGAPAVPTLRFAAGPNAAPPASATVARPASAVPVPTATRAEYLARLRATHGLDAVVAGATSDLERVRRLSHWVRRQWEHNGNTEPTRPDPLAILAEARTGKRFRCVEYAHVLAAALSAVGVPARVVGLQRADVETATSGAGHVVAEAWLRDRGRWVLVDGQWDAIPFLGDEPLDAVALQAALAARDPALRVESAAGTSTRRWGRWIAPYLYFFVTGPEPWTTGTAPDAPRLLLAPLDATPPQRFQRRWPQPAYVLTRAPAAFHAPPPDGAGGVP